MRTIFINIVALLIGTVGFSIAQSSNVSSRAGSEIIHTIRKEKLDLILPSAMRENNIDMWIHVIRPGNPDPLAKEFGSASGYLIFTDRGGDRIERAVFGSGHPDFFDIFGSREVSMAINGYNYGNLPPGVYDEITEFVAERNPQTIAVNTSEWLGIADGISHSQYLKLEKILGAKYSSRIVSAEYLITDFRDQRVMSEINAFSHALEMQRQLLERSLSPEVITPGKTSLGEVGWWLQEEIHKKDLADGYPTWVSIPRVLYSANGERKADPDVRWFIHHEDYVIQPGDLIAFDHNVSYLDYFKTDYKRYCYVMKEGETEVPEFIQSFFDRAVDAREIIRANIKVGMTAKETLDAIVAAMEAEGYVYTPFIDIGTEDYKMVQKVLGKTDNWGFSIDLHSLGINTGSLVTVGPSVAPFRKDRWPLTIKENHFFAFEYMIHTNIDERPGYPLCINIEDDYIVTSMGVEPLHPPAEKLLIIR